MNLQLILLATLTAAVAIAFLAGYQRGRVAGAKDGMARMIAFATQPRGQRRGQGREPLYRLTIGDRDYELILRPVGGREVRQ